MAAQKIDIKKELDQAFCSAFPNPKRIDCLEEPERTQFLRTLGYRRRDIPISDPRLDHLASCSPCFQQFVQYRDAPRLSKLNYSIRKFLTA